MPNTGALVCGNCQAELLVQGDSLVVADRKSESTHRPVAPQLLAAKQPLAHPVAPPISQPVPPPKSAIAPPASLSATMQKPSPQGQAPTVNAPPVVTPPATAASKPQTAAQSTKRQETRSPKEKSRSGESRGEGIKSSSSDESVKALPAAADLLPPAVEIMPPPISGASSRIPNRSRQAELLPTPVESELLPPPIDAGMWPAAVAGDDSETAEPVEEEVEEEVRQILIPSEEGGFVAVAETITKINYRSQKIGVRNVSHEQRDEKRRFRSAIVFLVCAIFLVVVGLLLKSFLN